MNILIVVAITAVVVGPLAYFAGHRGASKAMADIQTALAEAKAAAVAVKGKV